MKGMMSSADPEIEKSFNNLLFMALCLEVALMQESYMKDKLDELQLATQKVSSLGFTGGLLAHSENAFPGLACTYQSFMGGFIWCFIFGGFVALSTFWWVLQEPPKDSRQGTNEGHQSLAGPSQSGVNESTTCAELQRSSCRARGVLRS